MCRPLSGLIIASERAGPAEVVKALKQTSVHYVEVKDGLSPEGVVAKVRFVAGVVGDARDGDHRARQRPGIAARGPPAAIFKDDLLSSVFGCAIEANKTPADGVPYLLPHFLRPARAAPKARTTRGNCSASRPVGYAWPSVEPQPRSAADRTTSCD